jgi:carboxypeptidase T
MNRYIVSGLFFLLFISTTILVSNTLQEHEMLVRVKASQSVIQILQDAGLYIYAIENGYIRGAILPSNIQRIKQMGYKYEVLIPDMVEYSEQIAPGPDLGRYHSYQEIMDTFNLIANTYPNICHLDTIGQSPTGKYLLALKISENAQAEMHRPRMLWDGTTHGNENIGTEVCWYIMQQLITRYNIDPIITNIVNTREIWIIPCINPEGLINHTRGTTVCADLNRDYGYAWRTGSGSGMSTPWSQPETRGFRNFLQQHPFVLHMTYHSGATSVMWPWSYTTMAPLDSVSFSELCNRYHNITGLSAYQISRGLYVCYGTATDYSYGEEGTLGLAAEISSGQPPAASQIDTICHANWTASLDLMTRCANGIRGLITDSITGLPIQKAIVVADPPNWMTYTDTCGWYFKYIQPGIHNLKIIADGYQTKIISGISVPIDSYVDVNAMLQPDTVLHVTGYKIVTWICQSTTLASGTMASWTLGPRDNRVLKLSSRSSVAIELSKPILDSIGIDFTVYSITTKPCSVFVSDDAWTGPWHFCTYGTGNVGCNITNAGVSSARYVKVADAGQNYELDAIEFGSAISDIAELPIYELQKPILVISPNPFRHTTKIQWQTAGNNITEIKIYNTAGSLVKTFSQQQAKSVILWNGTDNFGNKLSKGIYFVRLETNNSNLVDKVILTD